MWQVSRITERKKHILVHDFSEDNIETPISGSGNAQKRFLRLIRTTIAYYEQYSTPFTGSSLSILHDETQGRGQSSYQPSTLVLGMHQIEQRVRVFPIFGPDAAHLTDLVHAQNGAGRLYYTTQRHAFGLLSLQNDMVMADESNGNQTDAADHIENYWWALNQWILKYRMIPLQELHLFIGEISFRFHHRNEDLSPLILKWAKQTPYHAIKHM